MSIKLNNFYKIILLVVFFYLPIETITTGIQLKILFPTYLLLLLIFIMILFFYLTNIQQLLTSMYKVIISSSIFIIILILIIFSYLVGYLNHISNKDLFIHLIYTLSYFFIGLYLSQRSSEILNYLFNKKNQLTITLFFLVFFITYFILLIISNNFNLSLLFFGFGNKIQYAGIHLVISSMISIMIILQLSKSIKMINLIYWFLLGFIVLFILGSRSALLFYLISTSFLLFLKNKKNFLLILLSIFFIILIFSNELLTFLESRERFYSLFTFDQTDSSFEERKLQTNLNMSFVRENIFTGLLMSEILTIGKGNYIHSYLSYLQSYGIIVFTLINYLILRIVYYFFIFRNTRDEKYLFMISIFIYILLEFIFSRGYLAYHLFMFLIICESYTYKLNKIE